MYSWFFATCSANVICKSSPFSSSAMLIVDATLKSSSSTSNPHGTMLAIPEADIALSSTQMGRLKRSIDAVVCACRKQTMLEQLYAKTYPAKANSSRVRYIWHIQEKRFSSFEKSKEPANIDGANWYMSTHYRNKSKRSIWTTGIATGRVVVARASPPRLFPRACREAQQQVEVLVQFQRDPSISLSFRTVHIVVSCFEVQKPRPFSIFRNPPLNSPPHLRFLNLLRASRAQSASAPASFQTRISVDAGTTHIAN